MAIPPARADERPNSQPLSLRQVVRKILIVDGGPEHHPTIRETELPSHLPARTTHDLKTGSHQVSENRLSPIRKSSQSRRRLPRKVVSGHHGSCEARERPPRSEVHPSDV